jgi:hypothetical protein
MPQHGRMQNKSLSGTLMVLAAAVLWGTTGTSQSLVPTHLSAYWIGALRLVVAAAFFAAVTLATRAPLRQGLRTLPGSSVLLAGACVAGYNLAFFAGVKATGVAIGPHSSGRPAAMAADAPVAGAELVAGHAAGGGRRQPDGFVWRL